MKCNQILSLHAIEDETGRFTPKDEISIVFAIYLFSLRMSSITSHCQVLTTL